MKIEIAQKADLKELVEIYNQAIDAKNRTADLTPFTFAERLNWFASHENEKYPLFVAKINDKVIGYATLNPYRGAREALLSTAEVSYYVHFDFHQQGVATALLKKCINYSKEIGFKNLVAILLSSNEASIRFIEKNDFTLWGTFPGVAIIENVEVDHLYFGRKI